VARQFSGDTPQLLRLLGGWAAYGRVVGLTGVIYAAIVVAWAIFLVPLALRRHDQTARNRSIERFSSSMRVLSAGGRGTARSTAAVTPRRDGQRLRPSAVTAHGASVAVGPISRAAMRAAAARRRRVLRVLVALTCFTGAASVLGVIPRWSAAVPLVGIAVFLVVARRQVRIANESYWRRAANAHGGASNVVRRTDAEPADAPHEFIPVNSRDKAAKGRTGDRSESADQTDPSDDEPTITLTAAQVAAAARVDLSEDRVVAVRLSTSDGSSLWDPLPVTLPSYVDKPVAKRTVRKITIGESGTWSAGHAATGSSAYGSTAVDEGARGRGAWEPPVRGTDEETAEAAADEATERPRAANA
jgi:hypothetical protein